MVNKKVIDDYYSNIDSKESSKKDSVENKKPRVVVKKKVILKKQEPTDKKNTTINLVKNPSDKNQRNNNSNTNRTFKPRVVVQKLEVVKKEDKKPQNNSQNRGFSQNRNSTQNKDSFQNRGSTQNRNSNDSNNLSSWTNTKPDFSQPRQSSNDFSQNKSFKKPLDKKWSKFSIGNKAKEEEWAKKQRNLFRKTRGKVRNIEDVDKTFTRSNKIHKHKKEERKIEDIKQNLVDRKGTVIIVPDFLSIKELSEKIGIILPRLIAEFMKNGIMVNINSKIDYETAAIVSEAFEIKLERDNSSGVSVEEIVLWDISSFLVEDDSSKLINRSPVISIMWHVDHWKTSLLDYIRKSKVASWEAGWITQSIWAYQVELDNGSITFLDTPGHEAFTIMRARWAKSTDIAVLVVAADEGVKPQTIESINHAKEAGIPVIVAINKMDKEWANPDHVKWQLAEHWLTPEDWGGDTPMIPVSAHSWFWIDDLLEIILLVAEMKELKANPDRNWVATILESHLDPSLWPVSTVLINTWTINSGDNIVCQDSFWKVKILKNYCNQKVKKALPWEPVLIVWLDKVVDGWDILQVVNNSEIAKTKAIEYKAILEKQKKAGSTGLDLLMSKIRAWNLKQLKIILKADTNGSLEAMKASLVKLSTEETTVSIIHAGVWSISEWDILMWKWSQAILVWFNVWVLPTARWTLDSAGVEYISSEIIYHITDRIEKIVTWMLDPKEVEIILGKAKVWGIFFTDKKFLIVGLILWPDNKIENNTSVRIIRKKKMIGHWKIESLKQWTLEVKEVEGPVECWIKLVTNVNVEIWDDLEVYKIEIQK